MNFGPNNPARIIDLLFGCKRGKERMRADVAKDSKVWKVKIKNTESFYIFTEYYIFGKGRDLALYDL